MEEYVNYTYNKTDTTVKSFLNDSLSIVDQEWSLIDFLKYEITLNGVTYKNIDNLWISFLATNLDEEKEDFWFEKWSSFSSSSSAAEYEDFPLVSGTLLYILNTKINRYNAILDSKNQVIVDPDSGDPFIVSALKELINNPLYTIKKNYTKGNSSTSFVPKIRVWLWSRTLSMAEGSPVILNMTPFIEQLSTQSNSNTGTWNMTVSPVLGNFSREKWFIDSKYITFFSEQGEISYTGRSYLGDNGESSHMFFDKIIQKNDIIFISYEPLDLEHRSEGMKYFVRKEELAGNIYDMIGLVDSSSLSKIYSSGTLTLNLNGSDLSRVLNDDTFYFYPEMYLTQGLFYKGLDDKGLMRVDNALPGYITIPYKNISTIFQFIINALSTIGIVGDELFTSWGNEISTYFKLPGSLNSQEEGYGPGSPVKGIWQIIKIVIDKKVESRYLVDTSLGNATATALDNMRRSIQEPFVQLLADTYKNQFFLTIRQPPWDKNGYTKFAKIADEKFSVAPADILSENLGWNNDEVFSWYRIMPTGLAGGVGNDTVWAYLKAVRFPEYSEIWGEKSLEITSNYIRMSIEQGSKTVVETGTLYEQAIRDLKFMVDCYQYMPFVRRGSIVIKGDRRYKKGLILYLQSTDEYYYINGVQQNFSSGTNNDRTTTLELSRGMSKKYLEKYFNIINTTLDETAFNNSEEIGSSLWLEKIVGSWKVPEDRANFDFFLRRRQFHNTNELTKLETKKVNKI